jgi:flagellar biosynthesis protein FliP
MPIGATVRPVEVEILLVVLTPLTVLTCLTVAPGAILVMVAVWAMLVCAFSYAAAAEAMNSAHSAMVQIGMRW